MLKFNFSDVAAYFEEAFNRVQIATFVYNLATGRFLYLNHAFEKIWAGNLEEAVSQPHTLTEKIHPNDRSFLYSLFDELQTKQESIETSFRIQHAPEEEKWLRIIACPVQKSSIIAGFLQDISLQKENEELMKKFASKKNSVLEILSHDLAGPLSNIKNLSSLLKEKVKETETAETFRIITMIEQTSQRSIQMIREFVQQEFLESENADILRRRVDIVKKLQDIMEQYKNSEREISKTFLFSYNTRPIWIEIDDYKFSQVINNLISNSIKFTGNNGVIKLQVEDYADTILITISDNGIGIPDKYQKHLFEKFTPARRPGLKGEPSTGLGMSIIKTIVEWHNGKIWFKSKEHQGSSFYIELPKN